MQVLLVEDDINLAMAIEYALKGEGYEVIIAGTVEEAITSFSDNISFILLDVMLPDGSGYQILTDIRKKSQVPVIFLTACDEEANVVMGLDIGADDYITKPIRVRELLSRIKAVLRRKGSSICDFNVLKSHNISLMIAQSRVKRGDNEVILTSLEYKLLLALIQNPKIVMQRSKLLDLLWDNDGEFVDDNALSVYIRRLREKIEEDSENAVLIKTVRGVGYKWDADVRRE